MTYRQNESKRIEFNRRKFLRTATVAGVGVSGVTAFSGGAAAHPPGCDVLVDPGNSHADASTVQGGVDTASAGDTVCVAEDTYTEQVVINKDLTLTNVPGDEPTIETPSDPDDFTIPESGGDYEPIVFAFGGSESGTDPRSVSGSGTVNVSISGFTIDGLDRQPNTRRSVGIFFRNVKGPADDVPTVENNSIQNMAVGGKQTLGVWGYGDSTLKIWDNAVDGYERVGIGGNGDGGAHPSPTLDIRRNEVTGSGDGSGTAWAPNGIQIGFGAEGKIKNNVVKTNRYSDDAQVASGIIVFESDGVNVSGNTVKDSDGAITLGTWAWFRQTANDTKISQNDVDGAVVGVHLEARADPFGGFIQSIDDPTLRNTKITNNDLTQGGTGDPSESVGIQFATSDSDTSDTEEPVIENTKVIRNEIEGFDKATDTSDGTDTKKHANPVE